MSRHSGRGSAGWKTVCLTTLLAWATTSNTVLLNAAEQEATPEFSLVFRSDRAQWASPREVARDPHGNLFVVGHGDYRPDDFHNTTVNVIGALDHSNIFIIKLAPEGMVQWVTLIGGVKGMGAGAGADRGYGLALDSNNHIYVAGSTASTDFPTTPGAFDRTHNGGTPGRVHGASDAYALKLSADGGKLIYSTFLGGSQNDSARGGLEVDPEGNAYVVGGTSSPDFVSQSANRINSYIGGKNDGFVTKVSADGSEVIFNRFFGTPAATASEVIIGARVGTSGNLYISGSGGVRTTGRDASDYTTGQSGTGDVYLAKISGDGRELMYSVYFGGSGFEGVGHRMAIDVQENIYVAGGTLSADLPVLNAHQAEFGGGGVDGYLLKIDAHGKLLFSTYLGGSESDTAYGPSVDSEGFLYVTGRTASSNFPVTPNALDNSYNGGDYDTFFQVYSPDGKLVYSTFLGGNALDYARYAGAVGDKSAVIVGHTMSSDFPTSDKGGNNHENSGLHSWLGRIFINDASSRSLFITKTKVPAESR